MTIVALDCRFQGMVPDLETQEQDVLARLQTRQAQIGGMHPSLLGILTNLGMLDLPL